ncbi:fungal-specific transcription factor domain-containing protein [Sporodiniella umbellata]|nr:fungal-specific transcription factor domain-containing protein [Sporodiniella umbellata]
MSEQPEQKRQRVSKACEQCRKKKVKCDGSFPYCTNCITLQLQCSYKESTKKRGPPKGYIEAIESRLHRLEALLGSIVQEDDPRSQALLNELNAPLETPYGELVRPRPMRGDTSEHEDDRQLLREMNTERSSAKEHNHKPNDLVNSDNIDESGQLRYYGKTSGFYMLRANKNLQDKLFHFNSKNIPLNPHLLSVDPLGMPPKDLEDHLLDLYFKNFYPLLPILHKKLFIQSFNRNEVPSLLLNAIYAVASRVSPDPRVRADPSKPETAGEVFFERARLLLDLEWDNFKLYTVQSLLLMSSHQNGALKTTRGWLYSGMAIRMSQNLGLHRNCDSWNITNEEKEERKRLFYSCFIIDRLSCAMHGRSPMIDDRDYDTPYPSESDEDDLQRVPRVMENFHYLIKICEILGEVIRDLYMVKGRSHLSLVITPDGIVSSLDKKLNKWMAKLPPNLQYRPPNSRLNEQAPAPTLELCQLHMLFYTTLILTHRPFIPGPAKTVSSSVFPSASICTFAANKILGITESLLAESRLTHINNYSLFYMFTAGIIFIYNASSNDSMFSLEAKISINKIMHAMDEVEKTWITSARHCNILGVLAGLRDIDLECVDESYTRQQHNLKSDNSIAVPNSPEVEEKYFMDNNESIGSSKSPHGNYLDRPGSSVYTSQQENAFDPNATAFWEMPMSFDVGEWNSYFSNQKGVQTTSDGSVMLRPDLPTNYRTDMPDTSNIHLPYP